MLDYLELDGVVIVLLVSFVILCFCFMCIAEFSLCLL